MNEIVFLKSMKISEKPYTTSLVISKYAGIEHRAIRQMINNYKDRLKKMGKVTFEMHPMPSGQKIKNYKLNEMQATFLITLLKNTERVVDFKERLTKQFYAMKEELMLRQLNRQQGKENHSCLTEAIKNSGISEKYYFHYMNLAYKTTLGSSAKKLREERGANKKSSPLDYLTSKELQSVAKREQEIAVLIGLGLGYERIKAILTSQGVIYQTTIKTPQNAN